MRFRLAPHIYAGKCNDDIIILDIEKDKYISITDKAASALQATLENDFTFTNDTYTCAQRVIDLEVPLSEMIEHFLSIRFIEICDQEQGTQLPNALMPGGLANYRWDHKSSMTAFSRVSKRSIITAFITLIKVESLLKKQGIKGILEALKKEHSSSKVYHSGTEKIIQELSDSVDIACSLYPKKIFCLGWASTFTLVALRNGINADLIIGVQNMPFYAHAWAEVDGNVINDDVQVRNRLTPLLKVPFGN
jgi:hypothetical protein